MLFSRKSTKKETFAEALGVFRGQKQATNSYNGHTIENDSFNGKAYAR